LQHAPSTWGGKMLLSGAPGRLILNLSAYESWFDKSTPAIGCPSFV
jgi:hypothetical protein